MNIDTKAILSVQMLRGRTAEEEFAAAWPSEI